MERIYCDNCESIVRQEKEEGEIVQSCECTSAPPMTFPAEVDGWVFQSIDG